MIERITHPSPNFDDRSSAIDMIVLHYTGMRSGAGAIERLCDPAAGVSAHYVVEEDGRIFCLVPEEKRAWHAGVSHWQGREAVNDFSIGIEIVHPGHEWGYRPFPEVQIASVQVLVRDAMEKWSIPQTRIVGHSDVAPERKEDPGELFPWRQFAQAGLAIAPVDMAELSEAKVLSYEACFTALKTIGYKVRGVEHSAPVLAFQRRFIPSALGKGPDRQTRQALGLIAAQF